MRDVNQEELLRAIGGEENAEDDFGTLHLRDYFQVVLQRLPMALTVFFIVLLIGVLYTWTRTPRFRASSRILVQPTQVNLTDIKSAYDSGGSGSSREFIQTQVKLVKSRPVMENVLEKAGLLADSGFSRSKEPVKLLSGMISVVPVRNTYLLDIYVEHGDSRKAAIIVNATVDAFLAENRKRRMGISEEGLRELHKKASVLRGRLDEATRTVQSFMVDNKVVSLDKAQNIIIDRLRDLSSQLTAAEPRRIELQARVEAAEEAIGKGVSINSLPDVIASPVIKQFKLDLATLQQNYSQLLQRLGENHPQLLAVQTQMESLQIKIALEASTILASIRTQYEQAESEEILLKETLAKQEEAIFRFNRLSSEYDLLKQAKESIETTYQTVIRRIEEIDINRIGGQGDNMFVDERAVVPIKSSWPKKDKNLLLTFFMGMGLAVGLCFFLDYMDATIMGEPDVRKFVKTTVLAGVPDLKTEFAGDGLPAVELPRSHFAEAFRSLRTTLAFNVAGKRMKTLAVTSTFPSEGKTLVASNLAIAQATATRKTLVIDADMRKPKLHERFNLSNDKGLSNLLASDEEISPETLILPTEIDNLFVLPSGPIPGNPVELLDSDKFEDFIKKMETYFECVIIDSPPSYFLVDALVIGKRVDGVLMVIRSFVTPKKAAQETALKFRDAEAQLLGVVLNNVDIPKSVNYYGGSYYYGGYGSYYSACEEDEDVSRKSGPRNLISFLKNKIGSK